MITIFSNILISFNYKIQKRTKPPSQTPTSPSSLSGLSSGIGTVSGMSICFVTTKRAISRTVTDFKQYWSLLASHEPLRYILLKDLTTTATTTVCSRADEDAVYMLENHASCHVAAITPNMIIIYLLGLNPPLGICTISSSSVCLT
jgi:hypothetical protein